MNKNQLIQSLKEKKFSPKIIDAFSSIEREGFISKEAVDLGLAYEDNALPIGSGQTISQPYTIAVMLSELNLKKGQKVLEIGSGSGYVLALISHMIGQEGKVFGIERIKELAEKSKGNVMEYENVKIYHKNGIHGLPEEKPFDRILISAALREVPEEIMSQLNPKNGILVYPRGSRFEQEIVVVQRKSETEFEIKKKIPGFLFVPFIETEEH